jgi:hypothetical protein
MKQIDFLALISLAVFYAACFCQTNTSPPVISKTTRIDVTFFNMEIGKDNDLLKTITASEKIANAIAFANKSVLSESNRGTGLCHLLHVNDRSTVVNISFYEGDEYKGTLGIGPYEKNSFFLKYYYYDQSKAKCISNEEKKEFLRLIDLSEEEFQNLCNKMFMPQQ